MLPSVSPHVGEYRRSAVTHGAPATMIAPMYIQYSSQFNPAMRISQGYLITTARSSLPCTELKWAGNCPIATALSALPGVAIVTSCEQLRVN